MAAPARSLYSNTASTVLNAVDIFGLSTEAGGNSDRSGGVLRVSRGYGPGGNPIGDLVKKLFRHPERLAKGPLAYGHIVHVVLDDAQLRFALGLVLEAAGHTFRLYGSVAAFFAESTGGAEGCVVASLHLREMEGLEFQRQIKARGLRLPVIALGAHDNLGLGIASLEAGALAFVEEPVDTDMFLATVAAALHHGHKAGANHAANKRVQAKLDSLSDRERQVLDGLVAGRPNKSIAQDLHVSPRTIEVYRARLMLKMQAQSLSALVRMALMGEEKPAV